MKKNIADNHSKVENIHLLPCTAYTVISCSIPTCLKCLYLSVGNTHVTPKNTGVVEEADYSQFLVD